MVNTLTLNSRFGLRILMNCLAIHLSDMRVLRREWVRIVAQRWLCTLHFYPFSPLHLRENSNDQSLSSWRHAGVIGYIKHEHKVESNEERDSECHERDEFDHATP